MPPRLLAILTAGLLAVAAGSARGDAAKDMQLLQGEWRLVSLEMSGEKLPDEDIAEVTWTFQGDKLIPGEKGGTRVARTYKLDPTQSPKAIDIRRGDGVDAETDPGIYALDGDTLKVAIGGGFKKTRPKDFTPGQGANELLVFMRPAAAAAMKAKKASETSAAAEKDIAALQGEWKVVSTEHQGKLIPEIAQRGLKSFLFEGNKLIQTGEDSRSSTLTYTLDPLQTPKAIDLAFVNAPPGTRRLPGVYALDGDTLSLCINEQGEGRPPDFQTAGRDKLITYILERPKAQPIAVEPPPTVRDGLATGTVAAMVGGVVLVLIALVVALRLRRRKLTKGSGLIEGNKET